MVASPALYNGAIYAVAHGDSSVFFLKVDMVNKTVLLNRSYAVVQDGDASSVFVYNDTMLFAVKPNSTDAPSIHNVYAVNASNGDFLWEYAPDDALWNFAPASPGDGTILFAGSCGGVFRITFEGQLLWRSGPKTDGQTCGTGGGALGPNGVFYSEYSAVWDSEYSVVSGHVAAYRVSDGKHLWTKDFPLTMGVGGQYPAVGEIKNGSSKVLAVVAAIGMLTKPMEIQQPLPDVEALPNSLVAMNAETGDLIWQFDEPKWPHLMAAGDNKTAERLARAARNPKTDVMCLPDNQGIPLVAGDGTVYVSSSHAGDLRAIKDENGDGIIDSEEVSAFPTHNCFLNSPSLAQGMLVAAPCWGPMYVFKS